MLGNDGDPRQHRRFGQLRLVAARRLDQERERIAGGRRGRRVGSPAVIHLAVLNERIEDARAGSDCGSRVGQGQQRRQAHLRIFLRIEPRLDQRAVRRHIQRQHLNRRTPHAGRPMRTMPWLPRPSRPWFAPSVRSQLVQRPQRMHRGCVQADFISRRIRDQLQQFGDDIFVGLARRANRCACNRQNMLSLLSAATSCAGAASFNDVTGDSPCEPRLPSAGLFRVVSRPDKSINFVRASCRVRRSRRRRLCRS